MENDNKSSEDPYSKEALIAAWQSALAAKRALEAKATQPQKGLVLSLKNLGKRLFKNT